MQLIQVGDQLKQSNGHTLTIDQIEIVRHDQKVKVYNFTVSDFYTYFLSDLDIWVHNIDGCNLPKILSSEMIEYMVKFELRRKYGSWIW